MCVREGWHPQRTTSASGAETLPHSMEFKSPMCTGLYNQLSLRKEPTAHECRGTRLEGGRTALKRVRVQSCPHPLRSPSVPLKPGLSQLGNVTELFLARWSPRAAVHTSFSQPSLHVTAADTTTIGEQRSLQRRAACPPGSQKTSFPVLLTPLPVQGEQTQHTVLFSSCLSSRAASPVSGLYQ